MQSNITYAVQIYNTKLQAVLTTKNTNSRLNYITQYMVNNHCSMAYDAVSTPFYIETLLATSTKEFIPKPPC